MRLHVLDFRPGFWNLLIWEQLSLPVVARVDDVLVDLEPPTRIGQESSEVEEALQVPYCHRMSFEGDGPIVALLVKDVGLAGRVHGRGG